MSTSHTPFAVFNHVGNPLVKGLLRSPLHGVASGRLALISVTGRKSGNVFTFPVMYTRDGDVVTVVVGWPERKRWWRNLTGEGAPVRIRLGAVDHEGHGVAEGDETSGVTVRITLAASPRRTPATDHQRTTP